MMNSSQKIIYEDRLGYIVNRLRKAGARVVMTNGCFDLLHPGHIEYLEKAKSFGDVLIVLVNDDESVKRLKGSSRPINTIQTRLRMLSSLQTIDWVIKFAEDTPKRLYCKYLPDVIVKGGDYAEHQIEGADCIKSDGGIIKIVKFVEGYSTTKMIERIVSNNKHNY